MASAYNATNVDIQSAVNGWCDGSITSNTPINNGTYGQIDTWDVSQVTNMDNLFKDQANFNDDISGWNTSNVTDMSGMFRNAPAFNKPIGNWNTANVKFMEYMFESATAFNQDIGSWNTGAVINMDSMFRTATNFNNGQTNNESTAPLNWNTAAVQNMYLMFLSASAFNQDISSWNTGAVTTMYFMFCNASAFNQEIREWDVDAVGIGQFSGMFQGATAFINTYGNEPGFGTAPQYSPAAAFFTPPPPPPPPPPPICFPKGTPVLTNLGPVAIEKLNPDKHTIRGKEIVAITQSRPLQKHIVCFEKDALSKNVPSQQTLCSMEHKVFYKGEMVKACTLVDLCENVTFVPYNGETLYNVLLKKHDKMMINNLICETLHPENIMAKISTMKDGQKKNKAVRELTKIIKENNVEEYQKLYASLK